MLALAAGCRCTSSRPHAAQSSIGREVSVPTHLTDGEEFSTPLDALLAHGKLLFEANWTDQEGGGRPLSKGTGRPLADLSQPLTGSRAFNRISGPDANSCAGCHNAPYRMTGGGGDVVTNVFVLGQRFDFVTFGRQDTLPTRGAVDESGKPVSLQDVANERATTGMFGAGYLEMLARQMTAELQLHARHDSPRRHEGPRRQGHRLRPVDDDRGGPLGYLEGRGAGPSQPARHRFAQSADARRSSVAPGQPTSSRCANSAARPSTTTTAFNRRSVSAATPIPTATGS